MGMHLRSVVAVSLIVALALPRPGLATGTSAAGSPAFAALVGTIALVNRTMEEASLNPMDDRKRRNVQYAVSLLPGAIAALALEYKQVKIDPKTFPAVRAMLGGFVDVDAPDRYKAFFKRPDPSLIPKVGAGFPQDKLRNVTASPQWGQMEATVASVANPSGGQTTGGAEGYGYDDNRRKEGASEVRPEPAPVEPEKKRANPFAAETSGKPTQIQSLLRDLAGIQTAREAPREKGSSAQSPSSYSITPKPKFWKLVPLGRLLPLFAAHAQGSEEEKALGSQIAEILMGVAAIITAIAPMVVAGIQASADVSIANINANTTIRTARLQADTSKYLADTQQDVAIKQAEMSQQISRENNAAQTERLNMQLVELRTAREDALRADEEKRAIEQAYNRERIELAKKQAADNLKLAKDTLNANLVQAGLVSGSKAMNSTNELSVQETTLRTRPAVSGTVASDATPKSPGAAPSSESSVESSQRLLASLSPGKGRTLDKDFFVKSSRPRAAVRSSYLKWGKHAVNNARGAREIQASLKGQIATGSSSLRRFRSPPLLPPPSAQAVAPPLAVVEEPIRAQGHRP